MKEDIIKKGLIRITRNQIVKYGTRRVNMDEVVKEMGISKRTLYMLFKDKRSLISTCLEEMKDEYRQKVLLHLKADNPSVESLHWILEEYIKGLYNVDCNFLADLKFGYEFVDQYTDNQAFWQEIIKNLLERCQAENAILADINPLGFAKNLMLMIDNFRLEGMPYDVQNKFCVVVIRGISQTNLPEKWTKMCG